MSTYQLLAGTQTAKLGADGFSQVGTVKSDGCCPQSPCPDICEITCSFIDLLPSGPMWDKQKREARETVMLGGDGSACIVAEPIDACPSMALYAVYAARVLHDLLSSALWPMLRENSPHTAVTTIDSWLERYGWNDCYRSDCVSPLQLKYSPYLIGGECGKVYSAPVFDAAFECALKHNILRALIRKQRGVIKNLDGLNWVIEPLGVSISPRTPFPFDVDCVDDGEPSCHCEEAEFILEPISETLQGCPPIEQCGETGSVPAQQAYGTGTIYPGMYAADCLLRSMLLPSCTNKLFH